MTQVQRNVLEFITSFVGQHGYPPTVREIAAGLKYRSNHAVHPSLKALARLGLIERTEAVARGIRLRKRGMPLVSLEDLS